jgi:hypothetical protein
MPLPDGFSEWENLQSVLIRYHNQLVRSLFSDVEDNEVSIPRGQLRHACLLKDDDTSAITTLRLFLFFFHARQAADLQAPLFGIPVASFDRVVRYKPQVTLYFKQDADSVPSGRSPVTAQVSFRLVGETSQSLTETEVNQLAVRIRNEFTPGGGIRWSKGRILVTYISPDDGVHLQIYALSAQEADGLIRKILDVAQRTYNDDFLTVHETRRSFPANPGNQFILGRSRKKPVQRPIAMVRFQRASLSVNGLPNPIHLVGSRFSNPSPIETF